jgi:glycosyltransferase involved in cell wall biosynthesis
MNGNGLSKALVSVVIPTYNRAIYLNRALLSLVTQTYKNFEVIVCDDGSTDNTKEVVDSFRNFLNIKYIFDKNWGGPARPRNNGCKVASGEYICFLDSDDWWKPQKLAVSVVALTRGADIIYHDLWDVRKECQYFKLKAQGVRSLYSPVYLDLMYNGSPLLNSSVAVKAELLNKIGGFSEDPELIAAEDFDCWVRLSKITNRFLYIPKVLGYYWTGGGNISNPKRTLITLKKILQPYFGDLSGENNIVLPTFWLYTFARAYYKNHDIKETKQIIRILYTRKLPLEMWLKVTLMLLSLKSCI